ncbi:restriction endonuclease subunit S [Streptomyces albus]|uniref:restriction endonuclease subunit S n=1 Tax=Streptomyces albus TaxID=1888 RepID=UPI00099C0F80|nr:restriction endonuclease subunit S [Streptomyces albus]
MRIDHLPLWTILRSREEFGGKDLPLLTVKSDSGIALRDLSLGRQPSEDMSTYRTVRVGDFVVNRLWARFGAYGTSQYDGVISPAYWVMKLSKERIQARYLHHLLRSEPYRQEIGRRSKNMPPNGYDLPWEQFRKIEVPIPPLEEQRRIADFLDTEMERIDRLTKARQTQASRLAERDYASISEALIPGSLTKRADKGIFPWLPPLPQDRPLVRLGYICRIQNGLTVDGKRDVSGDAVTRPYLRVANVQAGHVALDSVTEITVPRAVARRSTLRVGDVLMTEGGDLDKLGRGTVWNGELPDCLHQNHVFALRPANTVLDGHYLALMTQTVHGRCYFESTGSRTTNLASTNSSKILGFPIPLPSLDVQRSLVNQVYEKLEATAGVRRLLNRQLALMAEHRQALITAAVTGQFDVSTASGRNVTDNLPEGVTP